MGFDAQNQSFAALFLPRSGDTRVMYVSSPGLSWLSGDGAEIVAGEIGVYCLFFLISAKSGASGELLVNSKAVRGSKTFCENGSICASAVCSIHEKALPCTLSVATEGEVGEGVFVVAKYEV